VGSRFFVVVDGVAGSGGWGVAGAVIAMGFGAVVGAEFGQGVACAGGDACVKWVADSGDFVAGVCVAAAVALGEYLADADFARGQLQQPSQALWVAVVSVLLAVLGLLWLQARDIALAGMVLLGLVAGVALFWVLAVWLLTAAQRLGKRAGWGWMPALGRSRRAILLVVVFATGLFALLLLTTVRTDLLERWQETLPADAPDHFLINIQPAEVAPLQQFLAVQSVNAAFYPMIRGRLVAVNGKPVTPQALEDQRAQRLLEREFNLSSSADFPASNVLLQGQWFDAGVSGFSIEKALAKP
jgi:Predicted ABC-type transport system involved in lysophospholipase L1 biosynthesis, permease component